MTLVLAVGIGVMTGDEDVVIAVVVEVDVIVADFEYFVVSGGGGDVNSLDDGTIIAADCGIPAYSRLLVL